LARVRNGNTKTPSNLFAAATECMDEIGYAVIPIVPKATGVRDSNGNVSIRCLDGGRSCGNGRDSTI
jgi:hypothetical protein